MALTTVSAHDWIAGVEIAFDEVDEVLYLLVKLAEGALSVVPDASWTTLIDNVTFDDDPKEMVSALMDVAGSRGVWVLLEVDSVGAPTDVRFLPQFSNDGGTTFWDYEEGIWASMYFEDLDAASGLKKAYHLPLGGVDSWRVRVVCTGTDETRKFVVTVRARAYR